VVLAFELWAHTLNYSTSPFEMGVFQDRISLTICPGWLRITILLVSAS
jgi:hypothetical protein